MIRINLISTEKTRKRVKADGSVIEVVAILLLIALGGVGIFFWWSNVEDRIAVARQQVRLERQAIRNLPNAKKQLNEYRRKEKRLKQQLGVIEKLKNGKRGPVRVFDEISTHIPQDVWIKRIVQRRNKLIIRGEAETNESVAVFYKRLQESPYFKSVELQHAIRTEISDASTKKKTWRTRFSLACVAIFTAS